VKVALPRPVLSAVGETHSRFRAGSHGTTFKFTLNEDASVSIRIERKGRARKFALKGVLKKKGKRGRNRVSFSGRFGRRALSPGVYRATITASAGGQTSKPRTLSFTIVA
jgi:hypothetical protein